MGNLQRDHRYEKSGDHHVPRYEVEYVLRWRVEVGRKLFSRWAFGGINS